MNGSRTRDGSVPLLRRLMTEGWLLPVLLAIWFATQRYEGIYHDAELYTFQALARIHPDLLGGDLFLRYGSQDRYTLFSPIYAAWIRVTGIDTAAALLTAFMQIGLLVAIGTLARWLRLGTGAALAVCAALCLPPVYGSGQYFHYLENFVTPRMAGEALSLAGIAWALPGRMLACALCLLAALALHPIIAIGGILFLASWYALNRDWRLLAGGWGAIALLTALLALLPRLRQDDAWHFAIRESVSYLFVSEWTRDGYLQTLLPLLLLSASALHPQANVRRIALAALATGLGGITISVLGADLLHLSVLVQAQLWRCMWLAALFGALLAPETAVMLWKRGLAGRYALLLLAACYLLSPSNALFVVAPLTIIALLLTKADMDSTARHWKLVGAGAWGIFALALVSNIAQKAALALKLLKERRAIGTDEIINMFTADGMVLILLVLACILLWRHLHTPPVRRVFVGAWTGVAILSGLFYVASFWRTGYPQALREAARSWRALIPERAEVFIPENPMVGWTLLERPGYFSMHQAISEVFSRDAAIEGRRRALATTWFLSAHALQPWPDLRADINRPPTLGEICKKAEFRFVVSRFDLDASPTGEVSGDAPAWAKSLRLYTCPEPPDSHRD